MLSWALGASVTMSDMCEVTFVQCGHLSRTLVGDALCLPEYYSNMLDMEWFFRRVVNRQLVSRRVVALGKKLLLLARGRFEVQC